MARLLLALALSASLCAPAMAADCKSRSLLPLTIVQAADALNIIEHTWRGSPGYDQMMPGCAKTAIREVACVVASNIMIRRVENSGHLTCVANYVAALAYGLYIRKGIGAQIGLRF